MIVPEEVNLEQTSTVRPTDIEQSQNNDYKSSNASESILAIK